MSTSPTPSSKPTIEILIAEDSATQRAQLQHLLEEHKYTVVAAANGKEALAAAQRRRPTLIVSDVVMPELDGYGLCRAIKTDKVLKDVPLILVTTLTDSQDVIRGLECGADSFIRKPFDERYLLSRIDYLLMNLEMRGNHKMQVGIEIKLGGQKHFITSERQQVLDLLISTYEQAVQLNKELQQQKDELARANLRLDQANQLKSDFLANMSHELRTPLNAIIGFSEAMKDGLCGPLTDEQKDISVDIFASGVHLLELINDILDLSKIEAGMMSLDVEPVNLSTCLAGAMTVMKERAANGRVSLTTELEPGLETIEADPRKFKQILYNLLSNAVKFTPAGGQVQLHVRRVSREAVRLEGDAPGRMFPYIDVDQAEFVEITVVDSGVGITEENLDRLFQPFVQVDASPARREGGTGLGLAMIRRLAELHLGAIGVSSRFGEGTRFSVWIPYRTPAPAGLAPTATPAVKVARTQAGQVTQHKNEGEPLALVIEDDDDAAKLVSAQLARQGFRTIRAATAEEAMVRAKKTPPSLITLDILLPHADGWDFMEKLKGDPELADTPVVIISINDYVQRGLAIGARRVLQKPFNATELAQALTGLVITREPGLWQSVLVVDDNRIAADLITAQLEAADFAVLRAYGGKEALHSARSNQPALILLDLMMSEMSGFEVLDALKLDPMTAGIPVLVLTAKSLTVEERRLLNGRAQRVLEKGQLTSTDLIAEVRRALGQAQPT